MILNFQVSSYVGDKSQFFGPEDSISLSLEYYQVHLDSTPLDTKPRPAPAAPNPAEVQDTSASVLNNNNSDSVGDKHRPKDAKSDKDGEQECKSDKRFLQCPAAVSMRHLQKFIRMKFALTQHHKVRLYPRSVFSAIFPSLLALFRRSDKAFRNRNQRFSRAVTHKQSLLRCRHSITFRFAILIMG